MCRHLHHNVLQQQSSMSRCGAPGHTVCGRVVDRKRHQGYGDVLWPLACLFVRFVLHSWREVRWLQDPRFHTLSGWLTHAGRQFG